METQTQSFYERNKEHCKEMAKKYYEANRQHYKEYNKIYYQQNKAKMSVKREKRKRNPAPKKPRAVKTPVSSAPKYVFVSEAPPPPPILIQRPEEDGKLFTVSFS